MTLRELLTHFAILSNLFQNQMNLNANEKDHAWKPSNRIKTNSLDQEREL